MLFFSHMNFKDLKMGFFWSQQQRSQIPQTPIPQAMSGKALESGLFYIIAPG